MATTPPKVNVRFSKKDGTLTLWAQSVPNKQFSWLVREALRAELRSDTAFRLPIFSPPSIPVARLDKQVLLADDRTDLVDYFSTIPSGEKATRIKRVLDRYLVQRGEVVPATSSSATYTPPRAHAASSESVLVSRPAVAEAAPLPPKRPPKGPPDPGQQPSSLARLAAIGKEMNRKALE